MTLSDTELMVRVRARDAHAFDTLSTRYREGIYRHVLAMAHDSSVAEDVVQEVFLRIWLHADQWHGSGTCKSWLFRIATNQTLNYLRTLRRRRQQPLETPDDPLNEDDESSLPAWMVDHAQPGPEVILELSERSQLIQQLVNRLPADKREVLRLFHDAGMETRQVAEQLGIPEGTVKSRLHYATRRLAREWRNLAQEWEDMT